MRLTGASKELQVLLSRKKSIRGPIENLPRTIAAQARLTSIEIPSPPLPSLELECCLMIQFPINHKSISPPCFCQNISSERDAGQLIRHESDWLHSKTNKIVSQPGLWRIERSMSNVNSVQSKSRFDVCRRRLDKNRRGLSRGKSGAAHPRALQPGSARGLMGRKQSPSTA